MSLNQNSVRALKETQSTTSSMKIWQHPFFLHCQTSDGWGSASFMPALFVHLLFVWIQNKHA